MITTALAGRMALLHGTSIREGRNDDRRHPRHSPRRGELAEQAEEDIAGILPRMKRYGILLVHDVEQFALGPQVRRGLMAGVRRSGRRVSMTSLPYSDGLAIVRMEDDTGRGQVASRWCKTTTRPAVAASLPW